MMKLLIWVLIVPAILGALSSEEMMQKAQMSYQEGKKATTYEERKLAFNRALFLYSTLEDTTGPNIEGLNQAIADTQFQLGEYAWAILYYQRALQKNVSPDLLSHLTQAQQKLGLSSASKEQTIEPLFALSTNFKLLFWIILLTFITSSCAIWLSFPWIRKLAMTSAFFLLILLGNSLFFYYSKPLEGIIIKTTGLYRLPDWNQHQLTNQPLLAGSKVKILQITQDENWLKISDNNGIIGYIPTDKLRLI